jgi:drug/metabolite transporter (DMT)-like permease
LNPYLGEIAALLTSLAFSVTSSVFTIAGRQVGSTVVNRTRLLLAVIFLTLTHLALRGQLFPWDADPKRWFWLSLSGVIGLVLGDAFLFQAFLWIGPRLSMLMMSLVPVISTFVAWIFLDEYLNWVQLMGIGLTLSGIAWVILERNQERESSNQNYARGILFGLGGATGQALGLIFSKNGLYGHFSPISANLIRMFTAMIILWLMAILQNKAKANVKILNKDRRSFLLILVGVFTGPFLGVSLSLFAVQRTAIGVASTLMALTPVFLLPISYLFFKERFGWGAIAGTLIAVSGVALLFLV